jgi:hypothetical protein
VARPHVHLMEVLLAATSIPHAAMKSSARSISAASRS